MIDVSGVSFAYSNSKKPVLSGYSLRIERGEIVALTGRNGCGKTTLARLLAGMLRPDAGNIMIDGEDASGMDLFRIGQKIGYVFQDPSRQLFCDTVEREIAFGLVNAKLPEDEIERRVSFYLEAMRLTRHRHSFPGTLSLGEKQRVALACVLSLGTGYLVLDEMASGLDLSARDDLARMLLDIRRERECGMLLISHEEAFYEMIADRVEVMPG